MRNNYIDLMTTSLQISLMQNSKKLIFYMKSADVELQPSNLEDAGFHIRKIKTLYSLNYI